MREGSKHVLIAASLLLAGLPALTLGQNPPPPKKLPAGPAAPQSTHYPIFILAFGNNPNWSLRIGQKGPERMDRPGYPPIPLEPSDVIHETAADSWTYHAKDSATGAVVSLHLTREACTDATNDTLTPAPPPSGKYSFRASVDHAQVGSFKGCARIAAELFPKINNQPDKQEDDAKKKPPVPVSTVTTFKSPVAVAYLNYQDAKWQLWTFPPGDTAKAAALSTDDFDSIQGWSDAHTILVMRQNLSELAWIAEDGKPTQAVSLNDICAPDFRPSAHLSVRLNPANPDLVVISALFTHPPQGVPVGEKEGETKGLFLYEFRSKRRVTMPIPNLALTSPEWSRDGFQIFFTGADSSRRSATYRMFWDGIDLQKYVLGTSLVLGL